MRSNQIGMGAMLLLAGEFLLTSMSAIIKQLSMELPTEMVVFFRNLFGLLMLTPLLLHQGVAQLKTRYWPLHLLRGMIGVGAMYCYFFIIAHMPLAEATLVKLTAPFFMPLLAFVWLGENVSRYTWIAILIGFSGVYCILSPSAEGVSTIALVGLLGAALAALAKVTIRRMAASEPSTRIVFYFGVTSTLVTAIPLSWSWQPPSLQAWGWILLLGGFATCGQLLMTRAYSIASPGRIGPFSYSSVVFAALMGWLFWDEQLAASTVLGSTLIIGAGLLSLYQRNRPESNRMTAEEARQSEPLRR